MVYLIITACIIMRKECILSVKAAVQKYTSVGKCKHHRVMNLCSNTRNWAQPPFEITQAFTSSARRIYFTWSWMFQCSLQARICEPTEVRFHFSSWWKGHFCKGTLSHSSSYGEHCIRQKLQGIFLNFFISNI